MKCLLLATDLCANSDRAMERALKLAKEHGAKLHILHILSEKQKEPGTLQERATEIENLIKGYMADYRQAVGVDVAIDIIRSAKAHETICEHASKIGAELIVMGMHRKARFMDMFMATTFSRVLRNTYIPVLMVKEKPVAPYKNVLCGYDFAPGSLRAFDAATLIAPAAHFDIVHAYEKPILYPNQQYVDTKEAPSPKDKEECEKALHAYLASKKAEFTKNNSGKVLDAECVFVDSDPYYALIKTTEDRKSELVCVGIHGPDTSKIGPVTNSLMADPPCDILVTRVSDGILDD